MRCRDKEKDAGMSPASFIPMWVEDYSYFSESTGLVRAVFSE